MVCRSGLLFLLLGLTSTAWSELKLPPITPFIRLSTAPNGNHKIRVGLSEQELRSLATAYDNEIRWTELFVVRVATSDNTHVPPLLGTYETTANGAVFRPRFPLRPNLKYIATFKTNSQQIQSVLALPKEDLPATVARVYPTTNIVPENLLRFYLEFSSPMRRGEIYRYIDLLDENAQVVELPFLEIEQELWSRDGHRVMLLLDPGRVKRGLKPRIDSGPALVANRKYSLRVKRQWPDANGNPLAKDVRKEFQVAVADRDRPLPERWKVTAPAAGTKQTLVIYLREPLDAAMLRRVLVVRDARHQEVSGEIQLMSGETEWHFQPSLPWEQRSYSICVDPTLEDLAGNSISRRFEVDVQSAPTSENKQATIAISFAPTVDNTVDN